MVVEEPDLVGYFKPLDPQVPALGASRTMQCKSSYGLSLGSKLTDRNPRAIDGRAFEVVIPVNLVYVASVTVKSRRDLLNVQLAVE